MKSVDEFFAKDEVMVVLTTAPTGLGHIRVMQAMRDGLGEEVPFEVVGMAHAWVQQLHRLMSTSSAMRKVMEFFQENGEAERAFTNFYRWFLRRDTGEVYEQMLELYRRRRPKPQVMVLLATHFSLAHKLAVVKKQLSRKLKTCILVAVVVTDDSPQKLWAVTGVDFLFVPSETTRLALVSYLNGIAERKSNVPEVMVAPYPVSPKLSEHLTAEEFGERKHQVAAEGKRATQILLPISGAAVQLQYFRQMLEVLARDKRTAVTVVSRDSEYAREFLRWCGNLALVETVADTFDLAVIEKYEREFLHQVVAVEVSKPSEQTFKVLLTPRERGGVVMLFTEPVGRQERDNLSFLRRHGLVADQYDEERLERLMRGEMKGAGEDLLTRARRWRGVILPRLDGRLGGEAILRLRESGVLAAMVDFAGFAEHSELSSQGVEIIWQTLAAAAKKECRV